MSHCNIVAARQSRSKRELKAPRINTSFSIETADDFLGAAKKGTSSHDAPPGGLACFLSAPSSGGWRPSSLEPVAIDRADR
jgi:hypothetical protein